MNNKEKGNSNVFIVLAIFVAIGIAGYFYIVRDQSSEDLLVSSVMDARSTPVDSNFLAALNELKRLKLDDSLFKSPLWTSLVDFGKELAPQEKFRSNPFAPLPPTFEVVSAVAAATAVASSTTR
ncbi:MAG: hypothetical protein RLZZ67_378 [Candidatus Parcubacteria bacterium]|jgi:hypothetical protein